jgi:hypothetical protein
MTIYRVRRLTASDEPQGYCECCNEELTKGYILHIDGRNTAVRICDECLAAARASDLGFHKSEDHGAKS